MRPLRSEPALSTRRDVVIADGGQLLDQPMTVAAVEASNKLPGLHVPLIAHERARFFAIVDLPRMMTDADNPY